MNRFFLSFLNLRGPGIHIWRHHILGCLDNNTKFCSYKWLSNEPYCSKGHICSFSFCFFTQEKCFCVQTPDQEFCTSLLNWYFIVFYRTLLSPNSREIVKVHAMKEFGLRRLKEACTRHHAIK